MFKKALCLHYCDKEFTKENHQEKIIENLEEKNILFELLESSSSLLYEKIMSLPHGTLFSRDINNGKIYVSLPFFSSHLRLPIKEGENVWIYEEENEYNSINSISNSYWLSRIHGLFFTEDVNYTYNIRDRLLNLQKILNAKDKKQLEEFYVRFPTNSNYENILLQNKSSETNVPRYFSNQKDLTIQGSNNTLINLSNEKNSSGNYENSREKEGKITLVAGRGNLFKKSSKLNEEKIKTKTIRTIKNLEDTFEYSKVLVCNEFNSTLSHSLFNNLEQEENFKLPSLFTSKKKDSLKRNTNEGAESLLYDASTITISENSSYNLLSKYKNYLMRNIGSIHHEKESIEIKDILDAENSLSDKKLSKISTSFFKNTTRKTSSPSICIHSSDINIISRNDSFLDKNLRDGSIFLIKNSEKIKNYAEVSLRENGNIVLNGNKVLIGDYKRESIKENGLGSSVIIGSGGDLNSLVLGEKLVALLSELISINKESFRLISAALKETKHNFDTCNDNFNSINSWANTHIHNALGPTSPVSPTTAAGTTNQTPVRINSIDINKGSTSIIDENEPKLSDKLENLIIKMDNVLSKFAKTS